MGSQEWDIQLAELVSLDFYDTIYVRLTGARQVLVWSKNSERHYGEADTGSFELIFTSKHEISVEHAKAVQAVLRRRNQVGCYHQIH